MTFPVSQAQSAPSRVTVTLEADTAAQLIDPNAFIQGARVLNYTASPVYLDIGTAGDPASGAPSDYVPAASGGVPGVWDAPYAPRGGLRAIGAGAGDVAVWIW